MKHRILARLKALGLTRNQASKAANMNREYLRELLKDESASPRWSSIERLAKALECDPNWLATGQGPSPDDVANADQMEAYEVVGRLPDELRANVMAVLRAAASSLPAPKKRKQ